MNEQSIDAAQKISLDLLVGACPDQLAIVRQEWPAGIPLTKQAAQRAIQLGLSLDWAAKTLLTAPALAAYEKARAPALDAYEKARAPALDAYEKARAPAWAAFQKTRAPALAAYEKATAPAWAAFQKAKAPALLALLKNKKNWKRGHKNE